MSKPSQPIRSLWSFLVGGASGFALGVLLAPEEGRQVRRRVAYLLEHWAEDLAGVLEHFDRNSESSEARSRGSSLVENAREQAAQLLNEADALIKEARKRRASHPAASRPPQPAAD